MNRRRSILFIIILLLSLKTWGQGTRNSIVINQVQKLQDAYTSQKDSLEIIIRETEAIANKYNDIAAQIEVLRIKGAWLFLSGKHTNAIETLLKGIEIGEKNPPCHELVITYYEVATVYSKNTNLTQANIFLEKGLQLAKELKDTSAIADAYNRKGIFFEKASKLDSALYFYKQSLKLNMLSKDTIGMSYSYENIATVLAQQNKTATAIQYLKIALNIRESKNDQYGIAIATINLSEAFYNNNQKDSAIIYAHKAIDLARKINFLDLIQHAYKQLSMMYKEGKNYDKALHFHEQYTALHDSIFNTEKSKQLTSMAVQFESERKQQQINVLSKQKTIQQLGLISISLLLLILAIITFTIYRNKKLKESKLKEEAAHSLKLKDIEAYNNMQNERIRISRELHDNIGAHLTFIKSTVDSITDKNEKITLAKEITSETIRELRKTVWLINKSSVSIEEFVIKLRDFMKTIPLVNITSELEDASFILKTNYLTEIFRSIQETVNNAVKYAKANHINIQIITKNQTLLIAIEDDGVGFDLNHISATGFGLQNIKSRINALSGTVDINSIINKGTCISIKVPL